MLRGVLVTLALVLTASMASGLDDACRAGASSLGDRRALAALRAAIDADCPCESPGGGPARRAFLRCARGHLAQALGDASLRRACVGTAQAGIRRATCGTNRVSCGQVGEDEEAGCRSPRPPAGSCAAPRPIGPRPPVRRGALQRRDGWTAGTASIRASVDRTASARRAHGQGLGRDARHPRALDTVVWYPSTASAPLNTSYAAVLDAPLDPSGGPYPVLMFSHGSCGYATQSLFLTALIASYGYVVVSPPHPGNMVTEFPTCGTPAAQAASARERPADIIYALDQMLAANDDPTSPFFSSLDPDRIGMSGHSFGGFNTYLVVNRDNRFKVAIPMAPAALGSPKVTIPSLMMLGQVDSVVNVPNIRTAYADSQPPKVLVEIENAGHYAFSDGCFPGPDCNPPVTLAQDEAHALVLRFVVPFLERYLAGRTTMEPFFSAAPPGAVLTQSR